MASPIALDRPNLLELARSLTPLQRQLLLKLSQQGARLLIELAMSVFRFPEEIHAPIQQLREANLLTTTNIDGSSLGADTFDLSDLGRQVVRLLRDPALQSELAYTPPDPAAQSRGAATGPDEAELLAKLGDAALQQGDAQSALKYYQEALELTRSRSQ
jgi:tetratricopeptide (TPR) repeat protein